MARCFIDSQILSSLLYLTRAKQFTKPSLYIHLLHFILSPSLSHSASSVTFYSFPPQKCSPLFLLCVSLIHWSSILPFLLFLSISVFHLFFPYIYLIYSFLSTPAECCLFPLLPLPSCSTHCHRGLCPAWASLGASLGPLSLCHKGHSAA